VITILIRNNQLIIDDKTEKIFNWRHRVFFNVSLGFEEDEKGKRYVYSQSDEFLDAVSELVNYLKENKLKYITDKKVSLLLDKAKKQNNDYLQVKQNLKNKVSISESKVFKRVLKPYQIKGLEHFIKIKYGANFSVPGSGKTTMVYAYFDQLRQSGEIDKIFVIGPFSSFSPWEEESIQCFGKKLKSARLVGKRRQAYYFNAENYELFLCHYQTAANDVDYIIELCKKYKILLVVDESHYIKKFSGGVWATELLKLAPYAVRRVILTGTPMPNGFIDLWSQMTFLWPGKQLLGERNAYKTRCADDTEKDKIKIEIRPYFYRVKKSDLGLPKPIFSKTKYLLKPIQSQIYKALSIKLLSELDLKTYERQKLKQWRKAKMVRLLQAASNPTLLSRYSEEFEIPPLRSDGTSLVDLIEKYSQYEVPSKFEAALNLTNNLLAEGKKVLIWTSFIHNIKMFQHSLKRVKHFAIHGAIPKDDQEDEIFNREKQIREFKLSKEPAILIANPAACAESISLHKICHDAIYLDRTFNCGQYIQSLDRIHRIGLDKNEFVTYHILIAKNTIDETIDSRLDDKHETMISVLEDEIPVGDLSIDGPELENENEVDADFKATVKDVRRFLKGKELK